MGNQAWWRTAVIYQIYIRSFADASGDGIGDIAGIRAHLGHLRTLGVDALWITPWYPSPMHDGGYDVADYLDIDPTFGTLDEARKLLGEAHAAGLRVVVDVVPNHTSIEHPWFRAALDSPPGSVQRARYHFRDGRGPDGELPPNDWISAFGGPAWTRLPGDGGTPGQWYLHLFAAEQPDLNWGDAGVRAYFEDVVRFWFDLGVDGIRVDAASALAKHPDLPDHGFTVGQAFQPRDWHDSPLWDVDTVHDIFRRWRAIADGYTTPRVLVGEVTVASADRLARYLRPDELHTAFNLDFVQAPWNAEALRANIDATVAALAEVGAPPTWVLSNHDETRHVSRYGHPVATVRGGLPPLGGTVDVALGTRRARAAALLLFALPGSAYVYQGEELGLPEVDDLPEEVRADPAWRRTNGAVRGRDGCRVPLPWSGPTPPFGFTAGPGVPWLPQPAGWTDLTVERQSADPASMLDLYRRALHLRRGLVAATSDSTLVWHRSPAGTLVFDRGTGWRCVANLTDEPLPTEGETLLASEPLVAGAVPPDAAAWIRPHRTS